MTKPLAGIKVLDFSTLLPGPMAGLILAEAGATVIKIERPGGEDMRAYDPAWGKEAVNFALLNRGKKSLALDLKDPEAIARLRPLIAEADVFLEQFRPGVMERLGLGYEAVKAINPEVIYCAITGYGATGPKRRVAGHDLNYIGDSGLLALSHGSPSDPVLPPALIADIAGGTYPAVMNILLALLQRERGGGGSFLDIAMTDSLFTFQYWAMGAGLATGRWPASGDGLVTGGTPRYFLYPTSDGRLLAAAPLEEKFWAAFCAVVDLPEAWRDDAKDPTGTQRAVAEIVVKQPASHWEPLFAAADCCCSIVKSLEEALADPHFRARGLFEGRLANEAGAEMIALPVPLAPVFRDRDDKPKSAPPLGADNDELLS
ncbi:MAG: CaiB/BaiF CoA-transferase family protein [Rhodospirillales bacterium]